jgi:hypothetical protein
VDAAHIEAPGQRKPKKVGSGHVHYAVQRGSKTASKAAKNSCQSPGNLLYDVRAVHSHVNSFLHFKDCLAQSRVAHGRTYLNILLCVFILFFSSSP